MYRLEHIIHIFMSIPKHTAMVMKYLFAKHNIAYKMNIDNNDNNNDNNNFNNDKINNYNHDNNNDNDNDNNNNLIIIIY